MKETAIAALLLAVATAGAGTPEPSQVVFGRVRDAYGFPYSDSGRIVVRRGGVECARCGFDAILAGGLNYRLALDMDSGGTPYAPYAVQRGNRVDIAVEVGGVAQPLIPTNSLTVGSPGSAVRLDLTTGTDADHDGLPDEWELLLCEQSDGHLTGIADVNPGDDSDGDGLSNRDEFNACTFAFLPTDLLELTGTEQTASGRIKLRFLTSPNISYRVIAADSLGSGSWYPLAFSTEDGGAPGYSELLGDGTYRTIYISALPSLLYVRLAVQ